MVRALLPALLICWSQAAWAGEQPAQVLKWPIWSGLRADARNSGRCRLPHQCKGQAGWTAVPAGSTRSNAAVDADGNVYLATDKGLESFDGDGRPRWTYEPPRALVTDRPPIVGIRSKVFVLDEGGINAVGCADGSPVWRTALPGFNYGTPNISPNGFLYLGMSRHSDRKGILVSIRPNGELMWKDPTHTSDVETTHTVPSIASNHTVFVTTHYAGGDGKPPRSMIWAIDFNGYQEWRQLRSGMHFTPVTLTPDNLVLFASYGLGGKRGTLWCLTMTGQTRWHRPIGKGTRSAVAHGLDGLTRVFDDDTGTLHVFDRWGELVWQYRCGKAVTHAPIVSHDNVTYVYCDGRVIALDGKGRVLWGPNAFRSDTSPVVGPGGGLVGTIGGRTLATLR